MSLAMRPNEVNTEVQYGCKVRHQAVIFLYTEVLNMRKNLTEIVFILFFVSDDEKKIIKAKMAQLGTKNMGAYLRKMAIDGYIIKVDYTQQKKLAAAVSRVASNINQICRRINSTGHFYADDVAELKERQGEIWQLLKSSQSEEL